MDVTDPPAKIRDQLFDQPADFFLQIILSSTYCGPAWIGGLAQANGYRGEAKDEEAIIGRGRYDIRYIIG